MAASSQFHRASPNRMTCTEEQELIEDLTKQSDSVLGLLSSERCKLSVLVTGGSQNGKSSIIKAIFGEQAAVGSDGKKIGIGKTGEPETQNVTSYLDPNGNFELIDTPGLEKNISKDRVGQIRTELNQDEFKPSIVWVVLNFNTSIEDVELELVNLVPNAPVIIIINKCDFLQRKKKAIQAAPECLEQFDELPETDLPDWMKKKTSLMAIRKRLLKWKNEHQPVRRIVITSLGSGEEDNDDDEDPEVPIGLETLLQVTWGCLDDAGRILLAQLQHNTKSDKIKGSIAFVLAAAASAAGAAWIPLPIIDSIAISSIQTTMVISLYKYWGVAGVDAKTFAVVFLKSLAPVIVSFAAGYSAANLLKFFFGVGTVVGGAIDTVVASIGTIVIGAIVSAYLSQSVYQQHQIINKDALQQDIQTFMESTRFKQIVDGIKNMAQNPSQITNKAIVDVIQNAA